MKILESVYRNIIDNTPLPPPETGGILGIKDGIICISYKDHGVSTDFDGQYHPNVILLNNVIDAWSKQEIEFCGIYHSHYPGDKELSIADEEYIRAILIACQDSANVLYFPLVFPGKEMIVYKVVSDNSEIIISGEDIIIINERK